MQLFLSPPKFQTTEFRVFCKIGFALLPPAPKNKPNKTQPNEEIFVGANACSTQIFLCGVQM
jgi:hypothetical protein